MALCLFTAFASASNSFAQIYSTEVVAPKDENTDQIVSTSEKGDDWLTKPACKFFAGANYTDESEIFSIEDAKPVIFMYDKVA